MKVNRGKDIGWVEYLTVPVGCEINWFTEDNAGYIENFIICTYAYEYSGSSQQDFIRVLADLKKDYAVKSKHDILTIWVENLNVIRGFFKDYITYDSRYIVSFDGGIEFRSIKEFDDTVKSAFAIRDCARSIIKRIFEVDKSFYLTTNQMLRKHIKKGTKNNNLATEIFPSRFQDYKSIRAAVYGGFNFMITNQLFEEPMIYMDLTSAYIWCIAALKNFITPFREENSYYELKENEGSIGLYEITYYSTTNKIHCWKDVNDDNLKKGNNTTTVWLTDIDLANIKKLCDVKSVRIIRLYVAEIGYLPKEIVDVCVDEYLKKQAMKELGDPNLQIQKATVNGIYGNMLRKFNTKNEYIKAKGSYPLAPQWGVYVVSQCKKLIIDTGIQLDNWIMSATDSIVCSNTDKNKAIISQINNNIAMTVMDMCDRYEYNFADLSKLGSFDIEYITKFKGFGYGRYIYTKDNKVNIKASGCNKDQIQATDKLYELDDLPTGTIKLPRINPSTTHCIKNGKEYTSYGSYWEYETRDEVESKFYMILEGLN